MEPISILAGTLGAKFLEEGIKFLWSEAAKIIERYHKRKEGAAAPEQIDDPPPAELKALEIPATRRIGFDVVERRVDDLERLYGTLAAYASGIRSPKNSDAALKAADELQAILSEVFQLPAPNTITSKVKTGDVLSGGKVTGVDLEGPAENRIDSDLTTGHVSGEVTGLKIGKKK